jgi:P-type Ca2+ transporter type 2C
MAQIQTLVETAQPPQTPLERQLHHLGRQLVLLSSAVCGLVFGIGLLRGYGGAQMLKTSIALAVSAIPEGLPTVATTVLAIGIRTLRRHHVFIRHLGAVEAMGAIQTLCLDKTGTLTHNKMSVVALHTGGRFIRVTNSTFSTGKERLDPLDCEELLRIMHVSALCSETEVVRRNGTYVLQGSSTENALLQMAITAGIDLVQLRQRHPLIRIRHRAENHNSMRTLHVTPDNRRLIAVKGSPQEVLTMCAWHLHEGQLKVLDTAARTAIESENERMASEALRVLGLAYNVYDDGDPASPQTDLVWLGLVGMIDPIRDGVQEAIAQFHQAGIDTVMLTGDQSTTAQAISKALRLSRDEQIEHLDATQLTHLDPEVLTALASRVRVFARVSPSHKLQIVQALQQGGKVVAMTGDGLNDGPALKAADIGIAMGHSGTDVAREVADVVLEDDNLETMIIAVSQGRTVYNNIRKSVRFLLATNLSEMMLMFTSMSLGMGQPLNAMQLLWINLLTDIAPGLALAVEPPEPDVLCQPPRDPSTPIVQTADLKRIAFESAVLSAGALGAYGYGLARYGMSAQANTLAFTSLTAGQLLHALSCRSQIHRLFDTPALPKNSWLTAALGGSFALQLLAMLVPGLRSLLGLAPLMWRDGIVIGLGAVMPLIVNEGSKRNTRVSR